MPRTARIGIVGDYRPESRSHVATDASLRHAAAALGVQVEAEWIPTPAVLTVEGQRKLEHCGGVWCAPGSPYASLEGALAAIRWARERDIPFLGTCGGFQHAVLEYARSVAGLGSAGHAEYGADSGVLLVAPVECPVREAEPGAPKLSGRLGIRLEPGSVAARVYGAALTEEEFTCNYELSAAYRPRLEATGMRFSGEDERGMARVAELPGHRFFLATLFQPQLSSTAERPHPVVTAFVRTAVEAL